ncbi:MAG TPA: hypothetical protein PLB89_02075 [Flavobacteriales bacterium]|nr:hypothetical protein [Flavobacteriales bacterium]
MRSALPVVLLIGLLATSCSKEEPVEPCSSAHQEEVNEKDNAGKPIVSENAADGQQGLGEPVIATPTGGDTDGTGISDDGDDLSDSERVRKKRR